MDRSDLEAKIVTAKNNDVCKAEWRKNICGHNSVIIGKSN